MYKGHMDRAKEDGIEVGGEEGQGVGSGGGKMEANVLEQQQ